MDRQQRRFDEFRHLYNNERPHGALGQKRPARSIVRGHGLIRRRSRQSTTLVTLRSDGSDRTEWSTGRTAYSSRARLCAESGSGFEEIDNGVWSLYCGPVLLARFDERERKVWRMRTFERVGQSTTRRELCAYVIGRQIVVSTASIVRMDPADDAPRSSVLTDETRPSSARNHQRKGNYVRGLILSPMFPAAR